MRPETLLPCRWHVYRDPFMTAVLVSEGRTLIFALQSTSQGHQIKWHCLLQRVRENRKRGVKVPYIKYCLGSLRQIIRRVFDMPSQAWLVKGKKMYRCSQNSYDGFFNSRFLLCLERDRDRERTGGCSSCLWWTLERRHHHPWFIISQSNKRWEQREHMVTDTYAQGQIDP